MGILSLPANEFRELMIKRFHRLPAYDQYFFQYGSVLIGLSASTSGLLCNQAFRQALKVRRGFLLSSLIMTTLPLIQTTIVYDVAIPSLMMGGKLNCSLCSTLRGTFIGSVVGSLGAGSAAALLSTMSFLKYNKKQPPPDVFRFCIDLYKPILIRMKYFFLFQALFSMAVSARYHAVFEKMLLMSPQQESELLEN